MRRHASVGMVLIWYVFATLCLFAGRSMAGNNTSTATAQITELLGAFSKAEFEGGEMGASIRLHHVRYSKGRLAEERKKDPEFEGKAFYPQSSPLLIVGSYRVLDAVVHGTRATAHVQYTRLARTEGSGYLTRQIIPDCLPGEMVRYTFIYSNNRWWILDPPLPRVSPEAIIRDFSGRLQSVGDDWPTRPDLSEVQREGFRKLQHDIIVLGGLRHACEATGN